MTSSNHALGAAEITLPATAPLVRITAGAGTAGMKTWNLRRPVTLFGSRRPAHIILHDKSICKVHCVIVHTGADVLLKDLHTTAGTFRNDERMDMARLRDGDVIGIGSMRIQVTIHHPSGVPIGASSKSESIGAAVFPAPLKVQLEHTDTQWTIHDAIAMIGRHPAATVRLPHDAISARHAILFRFQGDPAVYDLGSRSGVVVNGSRCTIASLKGSEHLGIGPCTLRVRRSDLTPEDRTRPDAESPGAQAEKQKPTEESPTSIRSTPSAPDDHSHPSIKDVASRDGKGTSLSRIESAPDAKLVETEQKLDDLEENIAESWERLNNWRGRIQPKTESINSTRHDAATLRAELDSKEAALRGLLHDLTRYHEQISAREKELAEMLDEIGMEQEKLTKARLECVERTSALAEMERKLKRSENALAQRWSRLNNMTCSHCGKPARATNADPVGNLAH